ncbi:MAG: AAA-like domain-containing protein [Bacteroidales bacterium]|jgi:type II secretory pathway predicted ATPase ExeA|nr:AAA-like domain-containing protein [Bacteroidales bacterium]
MREFNTAGPCVKRWHYMIDSLERIQGVDALISGGKYFVLHAARQSGKTTFIRDLTNHLNAENNCYAVYCSLENIQGVTDVEKGIPEIVRSIQRDIYNYQLPYFEDFAKNANFENFTGVLQQVLSDYCRKLDRPFVVFFDEADCLSESTLIAFLRQLRNGHNTRDTTPFLHSVALVGMRNIRDFKAKIRPDCETLDSASPFNIVTEILTLTDFTKDEVTELYAQHTAETGQKFDDDAIDFIYTQTCGQPWLVNAAAREIIVEKLNSDFSKPVTKELAQQAIQTIILRRDTHIDSLLERLKEKRVRKIIEPLILGENIGSRISDDFMFVKDLGLIKEENGKIIPSNPIYSEVIIRTLTYDYQEDLRGQFPEYQMPRYFKDGRIDMDYLMSDFQQFWRENSDMLPVRFNYAEAIPHFVLMGFLQRIINGGGQVIREMAVGNGRLDLCIIYQGKKYPIELKIERGAATLQKGLRQTAEYMDIYGCTEGWLCIFDRSSDKSWDEKIYTHCETVEGKKITIVGL